MKKYLILLLTAFLLVGCGEVEKQEEKPIINTQVYHTIEQVIETNSKYYVVEKGITDGKIEFETLIKEGLITPDLLKDKSDNSDCDGYVEVVGGNLKAYLICNNYKTE